MAKTAKAQSKRKPHDMGGENAGPVDHHEHTPTMAEKRIDAMMMLLRNEPRAFFVTDENRRTIESLTPETYRDSTYYEKWCLSLRGLLIEKGVLSAAEIEERVAAVKARQGKAGAKGKAKAGAGAAKGKSRR